MAQLVESRAQRSRSEICGAAESPENASPHAPVDEVEHRRCNKDCNTQDKNLVKAKYYKPDHTLTFLFSEIFPDISLKIAYTI
jgi:hypothetical protein